MAKGSRGGKRAKGGSSGKITYQTIQQAKNMNELKSLMNQRGIKVSDELLNENLKFHEIRDAMAGATYVLDEFGVDMGEYGTFNGFGVKRSGVMCAGFDGSINFTPKYFEKGKPDLDVVMNGSSNFHPKNQNAFTTASHEAGHILERTLISKQYNEFYEQANAWNKGTIASKIINESSNSAKKIYKSNTGESTTISKLIAGVSGYACKNRSECFAECIADYVANGKNASILSQEVWKTTKKYFGKDV